MQVKAPWRPHVSSNVQGDTATTIDATGQQQIQKLQLKPTTLATPWNRQKKQVPGLRSPHESSPPFISEDSQLVFSWSFQQFPKKNWGGNWWLESKGTFIFVDVFSAEAIPDIQKFT